MRLLPAQNRTDSIRCTLHTAYLERKPFYEALSYAWGDPAVTRQIIVNERAVNVTVNLAAALRRLRRRYGDRRLWVDALCINQQDNDEKSHQVNLMKDIYAKAPKAILWLGDFSDDSQATIGAPPNPSVAMTKRQAVTAFRVLRRLAQLKIDSCATPSRRALTPTPAEEDAVEALVQLPWWTRVWTVQEAILPRAPAIVYGSLQIPLDTLLRASYSTQEHQFKRCCEQPEFEALLEKAHPLRYVREAATGDFLSHLTFADALNLFRYREASDPRDRVFALLGLGSTITADYALSWEEVFMSSVRQQIAESGDLRFLRRIPERSRYRGLPTWAPDWSAEVDDMASCAITWLHIYDYYHAAGETVASIGHSSSQLVLSLKGYMVDRVSKVDRRHADIMAMDDTSARWKVMVEESCQAINPYRGRFDDAFWRLMICDLVQVALPEDKRLTWRRAEVGDEANSRKQWEDPISSVLPPAHRRRFFMTDLGKMGIGDEDIKVGDMVSVLLGGLMPFILRPAGGGEGGVAFYQLVGQTYVHGIMDGEVTREGRQPEWVGLV